MSFLSVLTSLGGGFGKVTSVVTPLEPAIAAIPVYGPTFDTIFNAVVSVESLFTGVASAGAAKKSVVTTVVNATVPTAEAVPPATLSTTIDEIVAALNALQAAQVKAATPATAPS